MEKSEARLILADNHEAEKVFVEGTSDFIVRLTYHSSDEGEMEAYLEAVRVALESFVNQDC